MPGTWGSLAALPGAALLHWLGGAWGLAAATLVVTGAGVPVAARYAEAVKREDPGEVVIDEVAGMWLTLVPLGLSPLAYLVGFAAFRLFDTLKPWPIRRAEGLPGRCLYAASWRPHRPARFHSLNVEQIGDDLWYEPLRSQERHSLYSLVQPVSPRPLWTAKQPRRWTRAWNPFASRRGGL
jgi:hypothetical protein